MSPLRVTFVAPEVLPWLDPEAEGAAGGAERQQVLLARELRDRGADVSFVTLDTDGRGESGCGVDGFRVHRAARPSAGLPIVRFVHPRLTSLWRALRRADADVYYQRCAGMLTGVVGAFCRRHGRGFVFASAHASDCDPSALKIRNPRDRALYFLGLRLASAVVAQTEEQRFLFRHRLGIEASVVRSAGPIGERPRTSERRRHVLWIAALRPWKRPDWFLELARRFPATPFVMAGGAEPGRAAAAGRIREAAAAIPNLRFLGAVAPRVAAGLQREAIAFVSTSEAEGFPNTTLEAWAASTPVVSATDPDGCIARSGGGRVAPSLDDLARELGGGLADPEAFRSAGGRGREHLAEHHDPGRSAEELLSILDRAAGRGAAARRRAPEASATGRPSAIAASRPTEVVP